MGLSVRPTDRYGFALSNDILITSEKVKRAYESAKDKAQKENKPLCWGRKPLKIDEVRVTELRSQGLGYRTIAKEFGCSYQTIRRVLLKAHAKTPTEMTTKKEELLNNPIV